MSNPYWELEITLSEYAGNHEREFTYWLFGLQDINGYIRPELKEEMDTRRDHAKSLEFFSGEIDEDGDQMEGGLYTYPHEEYGPVWQTLADNNSNAMLYRMFEEPSEEDWLALVAACKNDYQPPTWSYMTKPPKPVKITKIKLSKVVTEIVEERTT